MVTYLSKPDASEGFNQILDFLNGSSIKYALTVNSNIYVSCIKQIWNTIVVKQANDITRLKALVDKKKVVITEAAIREVLRLDDAEGVDCLPNEEIFTKLARMRYEKPSTKFTFYKAFFSSQWKFLIHTILQCMSVKRTSWNEFSLTMASAIICLSTEALDACAVLTRRVKHLELDKVAQALEITKLKRRVKKLEKRNKVRVLKLRRLQKVGTSQRVDTSDDTVIDGESNQGRIIAKIDKDDVVVLMDDKEDDKKVEEVKVAKSAQKDEPAKVQEVVEVVTTAKLIYEVTTASETVTAASAIIPTAEPQVLAATLTAAPARVAATPSKRRKEVVIRDPKSESTTSSIISAKNKSKDKGKRIMVEEPKPLKKKQQIKQDEEYARKLHEELNKDIEWNESIDHVKRKAKEVPIVKIYLVLKRKPQIEGQARKNMIMYLKNIDGFKMDYFKGMSYDDIRPIFEAKFNSNVAFFLKIKEQLEEKENKALQKLSETSAEREAKRRKLDEEVEDLKRHLEIVPNKDDDVYTEATHLQERSLLLTIREDLEALWILVKERFSTAKPKNFFDDFLLTTLGAIEEIPTLKIYFRPDVECYKTSCRGGNFGVDASVDVKEICQVFNATGEELNVA
nr:hypothetical protein [Tanacetum cinerariifolium]